MESIKLGWWRFLAITLVLALAVPAAMAGPPLLCHPFNIGDANSLPWQQADAGEWNAPRSDYDTRRLAADTVALLTEGTPVIVRMETLRRAALYGAKDPDAVDVLLRKLEARSAADGNGNRNPLAFFDYGYLIETMKQVSAIKHKNPPAADGYLLIREALRMCGNDPGMEFAAALVATWPKRPEREEHLRKAMAGAGGNPLLAANVRRLNQ
jgi:hypothetical protein